MLKKLIIAVSLLTAVALTPAEVYAVENCVTVYGGGVVCSAETENIVHKPVDTDLGDIHPVVIAFGFMGTSIALFYISKKIANHASELAE